MFLCTPAKSGISKIPSQL
jgi:hypothetical protein